VNPDLLHNMSAYGGRGWSPRKSSLRDEAGRIWGNFGQSNEWAALKTVLLHRPGPELRTSHNPDTVQMLDRLDVEKARRQHESLAQAYIQAGVKVFYVEPGEVSLPNQMFVSDLLFMTPEGAVGGFVGVLIQGFRRGAFSNEAGVGSAAIAHSAVRTQHPASEGVVALLEPFIDTVVVCTMTALVIIITNGNSDIITYGQAVPDGVAATSRAFASVIPWFPYVLTIAVVLFAFSTMLSWSYYGLQSWMFLFGRNRLADYSYKILFCIFVILGSAASLGAVTDFSDAMIFAMVVPNMIGLVILLPEVRKEITSYVDKIKSGVIRTVK